MGVDIGSRGLQRRGEATEERASHRDNEREQQDVRIETNLNGGNCGVKGQPGANEMNTPIGKQETQTAAEKGHQQVFGEQLTNNAEASGSER